MDYPFKVFCLLFGDLDGFGLGGKDNGRSDDFLSEDLLGFSHIKNSNLNSLNNSTSLLTSCSLPSLSLEIFITETKQFLLAYGLETA